MISSPQAPTRPTTSASRPPSTSVVTAEQVLNAFHYYVKSSVSRAVQTGIFTAEEVESIDEKVVLLSPALAIVDSAFASANSEHTYALKDPRTGLVLTYANCPDELKEVYEPWLEITKKLKRLPEHQRVPLELYLSGLDNKNLASASTKQLAADINGLSIMITRRGTFKERFVADLDTLPDVNGTKAIEDPITYAILETFFAALAFVLESNSAIKKLYLADKERGISCAISFAIIEVVCDRNFVRLDSQTIRVLKASNKQQAQEISLQTCPSHLKLLFSSILNYAPVLRLANRQSVENALLDSQPSSEETVKRAIELLIPISLALSNLPRFAERQEFVFQLLCLS